jgi:hypothetical protein
MDRRICTRLHGRTPLQARRSLCPKENRFLFKAASATFRGPTCRKTRFSLGLRFPNRLNGLESALAASQEISEPVQRFEASPEKLNF